MILTLYIRSQCHLCEEMLTELRVCRNKWAFDLDIVEIDGDGELERRFGHKVPVLVNGKDELCHYFLDHDMLHQYFYSS